MSRGAALFLVMMLLTSSHALSAQFWKKMEKAAKKFVNWNIELAVKNTERQIRHDLKKRPHAARVFDSDVATLHPAMEAAFAANGYEIHESRMGFEDPDDNPITAGLELERIKVGAVVEAKPSKVKGNGPTYRLEILTGVVWELDGKNVVWLRYQKGESTSPDTWRWATIGSDPLTGPETDTDYSKKYYGEIMETIEHSLASVKPPPGYPEE